MSFALSPASPYVDGVTLIPASWLNFVRNCLPDAVDGVGGGTYNLLSGHTLSFPAGGGDIDLGANTKIRDGVIPSGGQLEWKSGSLGIVDAGSGFNVDGTFQIRSGGIENVQSGGSLHVKSGGLIDCENGSIADFLGQVFFSDAGGGGTNGQVYFGDFFGGIGTVAFIENGTTCTFFDDTALKFQGTSGHLALAEWKNFSKAQFDSGALLTMLAGSTCTLGGTNTISGATTITAAVTWSGTGAYQVVRIGTIPTGTNPSTINAWEADIWICPSLSADQTVICAQAPLGVVAKFIITGNPATIGNHELLIEDHGSVAAGKLIGQSPAPTGKERGTIEYFYDTSRTAQILNITTTNGGTYAQGPS